MKTSVFVRNKNFGPSCAYRICKYIDDIDVNINIYQYSSDSDYKRTRKLDKIKLLRILNQGYLFIRGTLARVVDMLNDIYFNKPDTVFIQREMFPKYLPGLINKLLVKYLDNVETVIWDFDDNIRDNNEITKREYKLLCEKSNYIIVSTEFLKNEIPDEFKNKCIVLHTTDTDMYDVDLEVLNKKRLLKFDKEIHLVWVGTFSNIKYLNDIIPYLDNAAKELNNYNKELILKVVSNGEVKINTKYLKINNIEWDREVALEAMKESQIGIMPLQSNSFTLGKAGFKAVQYIGMGLPTIVSDVGFNKDVIYDRYNGHVVDDEYGWIKSIIDLSNNKDLWKKYSYNSRKLWLKKFNSNKNKEILLNILRISSSER